MVQRAAGEEEHTRKGEWAFPLAFQKLCENLSSGGAHPWKTLGQSMDSVFFLQKKPLVQAEDASEEIGVGVRTMLGVGEIRKCCLCQTCTPSPSSPPSPSLGATPAHAWL